MKSIEHKIYVVSNSNPHFYLCFLPLHWFSGVQIGFGHNKKTLGIMKSQSMDVALI